MARPAAKPKSAAPKVVTITKRRCAACKLPIQSDQMAPVMLVSAGGRKMIHYHKNCR